MHERRCRRYKSEKKSGVFGKRSIRFIALNLKNSSEKGKPVARRGHKANGSLEMKKDGRAAGEKKEEK
jgi:hypothetical protein